MPLYGEPAYQLRGSKPPSEVPPTLRNHGFDHPHRTLVERLEGPGFGSAPSHLDAVQANLVRLDGAAPCAQERDELAERFVAAFDGCAEQSFGFIVLPQRDERLAQQGVGGLVSSRHAAQQVFSGQGSSLCQI